MYDCAGRSTRRTSPAPAAAPKVAGNKRPREGEGRAIPAAAAKAAAAAARKPQAPRLSPADEYAKLLAEVRKQLAKAPAKVRAEATRCTRRDRTPVRK